MVNSYDFVQSFHNNLIIYISWRLLDKSLRTKVKMTIVQYATRDFNTSGRIINIGEEEMPIRKKIWQYIVKVQMIMMKEKIIGNLIKKEMKLHFHNYKNFKSLKTQLEIWNLVDLELANLSFQ